MNWLIQAAKRLRREGVLGMNRRNVDCILDRNPRALFPLVDDKLRMHDLCGEIGVPTPEIHAVIRSHAQLRHLDQALNDLDDFVLKPSRGSSGRGVMVITGRSPAGFLRHHGRLVTLEDLRQHLSETLSGLYSLGGRPDQAIVQQRIRIHPAFERLAFQGIPDIRVIVYRGEPAMAMLRLPTKQSGGRANLHQGGIGAGVELRTGWTHHAVQGRSAVLEHPDTGMPVIGCKVPNWNEVLELSERIARAVGLGYVGVDVVIDRDQGPMLLEANARPGLAIQIANARGLLPRLAEIDARLRRREAGTIEIPVEAREALPLRKSA